MNTRAAPRLLFVDDDVGLANAVARPMRRYLDVVIEPDVESALVRLAREEPFGGFVFDMYFRDRCEGLRLLDARNRSYVGTPTVVLTGHMEECFAVAAAECGAIFLPKGQSTRFLETFALGCLTRSRCREQSLSAAIEDAVAAHNLTAADTAALCELCGILVEPEVTPRAREARNTRLLRKTRAGRMEILRADVLWNALTREWMTKKA